MKCYVWNDNDYVYQENFKERHLVIPPHSKIEMEEDDARILLRTFAPFKQLPDGQPDPKYYKKLRMETLGQNKPKPEKEIICQACNQKFQTEKELDQHIVDFHLEQIAEEEERDKLRKKK